MVGILLNLGALTATKSSPSLDIAKRGVFWALVLSVDQLAQVANLISSNLGIRDRLALVDRFT